MSLYHAAWFPCASYVIFNTDVLSTTDTLHAQHCIKRCMNDIRNDVKYTVKLN